MSAGNSPIMRWEQRVKRLIPLGLAVLFTATVPAFAGDPVAGREKAVKCKQCHGFDGIGKMPNFPNLAGQKEAYLVAQLRSFRGGKRQNTMMTFAAKTLSDEDIANLAAYYASIKVEVILPE